MPPLIDIQIESQVDGPFDTPGDHSLIERTITAVLAHENIHDGVEISVLVTDDATLQALNRDYRNNDTPTDVLSFGFEATDQFVTAPGSPRYLGDIAISYERVLAQAAEYGHTPQRELAYLAAHGTLHLLGYDHERGVEAAVAMRTREEAVMAALGLERSYLRVASSE